MRVLLAGLLGGILVFGWGAFSHMVLQVGDMGVKSLPDAAAPALSTSLTEHGFYFFPGLDEKNATPEQMTAWEAKYKAGPRGVVVFDPTGDDPMSFRQLGQEFASCFGAALILSMVVRGLSCRYIGRVAACAGMGIFTWMSLSVSYATWYRFPWDFTAGQLIDQVAGWAIAGVAIAGVVGRCRTCAAPSAAA